MDKPVLIEQRDFPFECSDSYGVEEDLQIIHWHQETEICYIKKGEGKYLINGTVYHFKKGDIFIISNDDIHLCYDERDLIMQVIMFDPSLVQSDADVLNDLEYNSVFFRNSRKIGMDDPYHEKLTLILAEIEAEYINMQNKFPIMIKSLLMQFIVISIRSFNVSDKRNSKCSISSGAVDTIRCVIDFIDKNYDKDLSLELISKKFHISVPYLCSCFKKLTGTSLVNYLIRRRIAAARRLLSESDKSIIDVSHECGFQSLSNFNHLFRDFTGCTPGSYRKNRVISNINN